jgi:hypothetical protein
MLAYWHTLELARVDVTQASCLFMLELARWTLGKLPVLRRSDVGFSLTKWTWGHGLKPFVHRDLGLFHLGDGSFRSFASGGWIQCAGCSFAAAIERETIEGTRLWMCLLGRLRPFCLLVGFAKH